MYKILSNLSRKILIEDLKSKENLYKCLNQTIHEYIQFRQIR